MNNEKKELNCPRCKYPLKEAQGHLICTNESCRYMTIVRKKTGEKINEINEKKLIDLIKGRITNKKAKEIFNIKQVKKTIEYSIDNIEKASNVELIASIFLIGVMLGLDEYETEEATEMVDELKEKLLLNC